MKINDKAEFAASGEEEDRFTIRVNSLIVKQSSSSPDAANPAVSFIFVDFKMLWIEHNY